MAERRIKLWLILAFAAMCCVMGAVQIMEQPSAPAWEKVVKRW